MEWLRTLIRTPEATVESYEGFSEPLRIAALSGKMVGLIAFLLSSAFITPTVALAAAFVLGGVLLGLIGPAVSAATVHPLIYYFGGRSYEETYKVFALHSPVSIFGAVPALNALALPVLVVLEVRALYRVHDVSEYEAAAAFLVPGVLLSLVGAAVYYGAVSLGVGVPV